MQQSNKSENKDRIKISKIVENLGVENIFMTVVLLLGVVLVYFLTH